MSSGDKSFLDWFVKAVRKHFSIGHRHVHGIMFTGRRVAWAFDEKTKKKKCISRESYDSEGCSKEMHSAFRSLIGNSIRLQSRTQLQACY